MQPVLSAIDKPLNIGDFVVSVSNKNGFIEVTKGIVTKIPDIGNMSKVQIIYTYGERYMYGKPYPVNISLDKIALKTVYGRTLVPVQDVHDDIDFQAIIASDKYKEVFS
jgi:hypothetical protein